MLCTQHEASWNVNKLEEVPKTIDMLKWMGGWSCSKSFDLHSMIISRHTQPFPRAGMDFPPSACRRYWIDITGNCQQRRETDCQAMGGSWRRELSSLHLVHHVIHSLLQRFSVTSYYLKNYNQTGLAVLVCFNLSLMLVSHRIFMPILPITSLDQYSVPHASHRHC